MTGERAEQKICFRKNGARSRATFNTSDVTNTLIPYVFLDESRPVTCIGGPFRLRWYFCSDSTVARQASIATSDARTLRVPVNVRRPCITTRLSTSATSPFCQGTSNVNSSAMAAT